MEKIQPGLYKHNKGQLYRVLAVAKSVKDREPRVIFQELVGEYETWILPITEWQKRFTAHDVTRTDEIQIDKVGLLLIHNKRLLMARTKGKDVFYIPGGKRESGESDMQCLSRQVKLELGVDVDTSTAQHYGTFIAQAHGRIPGVLIKVICYFAQCRGSLRQSKDKELAWFTHKNRDHVATVAKIIFDELYYKGMIE